MNAALLRGAMAHQLPLSLSGFLDDRELTDTTKGILIIAIVVGHNQILTHNIPGLHAMLYFWHVQGFFFLALCTRGFIIANRAISDVAARYMTPFVVFTTFGALANLAATRDQALLTGWAMLLWSGAAPWLEEVIGVTLFWFLPALTTFVALQIVISRAIRRIRGGALVALGIAGFALTVSLPVTIQQALPWCIGIVLFILPMAVVFAFACRQTLYGTAPVRWGIAVASVVGVGLAAAHISAGNPVAIANFRFGGSLGAILAAGGAIGANLLVVMVASKLRGSAMLRLLGQRSLAIYLYHIFILYGLWLGARRLLPEMSPGFALVVGLAAVVVAIGAALAVDATLGRFPRIKAAILPKDVDGLKTALASRSARAGVTT